MLSSVYSTSAGGRILTQLEPVEKCIEISENHCQDFMYGKNCSLLGVVLPFFIGVTLCFTLLFAIITLTLPVFRVKSTFLHSYFCSILTIVLFFL